MNAPIMQLEEERQRIVLACEALIRDVLKPRFLPEIRPNNMAYAIDIRGGWRSGRYRFVTRMRSAWPETAGEEYDEPYARLDWMGPDNFDLQWMRHTGQWWRLHRGLTLEAALDRLITDSHLHPLIL